MEVPFSLYRLLFVWAFLRISVTADDVGAAASSEKEQKHFIKLLFEKYGHDGRITFEGFEHLLESLGLAKVKIEDHDIHDHHTQTGFRDLHKTHHHFKNDSARTYERAVESSGQSPLLASSTDQPHKNTTRTRRKGRHHHSGRKRGKKRRKTSRRQRRAVAETELTPCMTPSQIFGAYQLKYENGLTESEFLSICPAMVYQLDIHVCNKNLKQNDCFHEQKLVHQTMYHPDGRYNIINDKDAPEPPGGHAELEEHDHHHHHEDEHEEKDDRHDHGGGHRHHHHGMMAERTWTLAEMPPSIWGFAALSVTIISLVGLGGVAVVPIMQKVFYNHLIQFLVALAVGSLTGDALLHLMPHSILSVETGHDTSDLEAEMAEKQSVYKGLSALGGIYFFFMAERIMAIISEKKKQRKRKRRRSIRETVVGQKLSEYKTVSRSCEDIVLVLSPNKVEMQDAVESVQDDMRKKNSLTVPNHNEACTNHGHSQETALTGDFNDGGHDEDEVVAAPAKKGHGHSHGGDGTPPKSIASVAWMVILGDGLHNFSDGLAIGAAFANSLTGGLSTSIAVFCHELPHELGDFAVLLKAGMSAKQALFYNLLSSILCFIGMIIGVCIGNVGSASFWIFAMTAGMFLYIALVDMLPEISTVESKPGESPVCHLVLHIFGITTGVVIMLLIALFEDNIKINVGEP